MSYLLALFLVIQIQFFQLSSIYLLVVVLFFYIPKRLDQLVMAMGKWMWQCCVQVDVCGSVFFTEHVKPS
jgi:hypothetical protein